MRRRLLIWPDSLPKDKKILFVCSVIGLLLSIGGGSTQVQAGNATSTLAITATVTATCTISTSPVSFGTYSGTQINANGNITVTCTNGAPWHISLDHGTVGGSNRFISLNGGGFITLIYELYKDAALSQIWADSDFANTYSPGSSLAGNGTGSTQTNTVYGKLPANQSGPAGNYSDTVTATVNF
jgi:spore coat protein U-like protein